MCGCQPACGQLWGNGAPGGRGGAAVLPLPHLRLSSEEPSRACCGCRRQKGAAPATQEGRRQRTGQWAGWGALSPVLEGSREGMGVCHLDCGYLMPGRKLACWFPSTGSEEDGIETDEECKAQGGSDGSRAHSGWWKAGIRLGWALLLLSRHWASNTILGLVGTRLLMAAHLCWTSGEKEEGRGERERESSLV